MINELQRLLLSVLLNASTAVSLDLEKGKQLSELNQLALAFSMEVLSTLYRDTMVKVTLALAMLG